MSHRNGGSTRDELAEAGNGGPPPSATPYNGSLPRCSEKSGERTHKVCEGAWHHLKWVPPRNVTNVTEPGTTMGERRLIYQKRQGRNLLKLQYMKAPRQICGRNREMIWELDIM